MRCRGIRSAASFVWVNDKYVLTDGSRTLEIYHVPNGHAANLLMSYVPQEKLLIITDIFNDFGEAETQRSAGWPCESVLRGARRASPAAEARRAADRALARARPSCPADMLWKALQGKVQAPQIVSSR